MAKFKVNPQFRKSGLSLQESSITAEVEFKGVDTKKIYDNVHYPERFAGATFSNNSSAIKITFKDDSDGSEWTVNRP